MILTQCAVCATDLGLTLGKKCGRCATRYCGPECQVQHWKEGGHDKICKQIKKAGGAEQYNANQKYAEAVTVAAEACAEDTKGQTCYICTQAVHWKTKEGLVRMCACRGTSGFAHVSCLAERAKILYAEAEENNLAGKAVDQRWVRWHTCSLCEQQYHGVVFCALGWACWKTYLGRPETEQVRHAAMQVLGSGLYAAKRHEDAMVVQEADLSMKRRVGESDHNILAAMSNLAATYAAVGDLEKAISMERGIYSGRLKLEGEDDPQTLIAANNYTFSLTERKRFEEAKSLLRRTVPVARRVLGDSDEITLKMRWGYAEALCGDPNATLDDVREAVTTLEETTRIARRVLGASHPLLGITEPCLKEARRVLHVREARGAPQGS